MFSYTVVKSVVIPVELVDDLIENLRKVKK